MLKKLTITLAALVTAVAMMAQEPTGGVKGTIVNRLDRSAVSGAELTLYSGNTQVGTVKSAADGTFQINGVADGMYDLVVSADGFTQSRVNVTVNDGYIKNMFNISLSQTATAVAKEVNEDFEEFDMEDSGYEDAPTILYGQNDVFNEIASFGFSAVRFRARGYSSESQDVLLAGVSMNDAITGYSPYSLWSGLNEATRSKETVLGNEIADYGFGGYNGLTNISATPTSIRPGRRFSVLTNSIYYRMRVMGTYAMPENDNGWSYAVSASARLGGNDWIKGVYYRSFAYYLGVEKNWNDVHRLALVTMATPGRRGAQNSSTQEVYDLVGDNMYNSNWGYQNGKVRNARNRITFEPITFLKYDFTPSFNFKMSATLLWRTGKNGYTAIDWYDTQDPRPDYYRNLPSYFYNENPDYERLNVQKAAWATDAWQQELASTAHINWDRLYNVNWSNSTEYGNRSKYVLEERRVDQNDINLALNFKWTASDLFQLTGGVNGKFNRSENYKVINDLLGGDYYVNIDQFAERDYASDPTMVQNDLDYYLAHGEAQRVGVGDKYGYDYLAQIRKAGGWLNGNFSAGGFHANLAAKVGYTSFWRDGLMRKGLFPTNSYGKSETCNFLTYGAKAGLRYEFEGGHSIFANAGYYSDAPTFNQAFVSPRTRNTLVPHLDNIKTSSADVNYSFINNGYNVRVTGFYTYIADQSDVMSFYDDSQNSFTNFAMSGIDQRHMGVELGFEVPTPLTGLTVKGALSLGEYIYTSNPYMTQTIDNSAEIVYSDAVVPYWMTHPVYKKDASGNYQTDANGMYVLDHHQKHYVPSTPQTAASLGLSWFHNYWFIDADVEYFDRAYLDMNPLYRTDMACAGGDGHVTPVEVDYMASQERFDPAWLLNFSLGKSWYIQRKYQFGVNLNVKNILNNKDVKTGGYEQTRLVDSTASGERYYRFDSKYFYMAGVNYMLNVYFRF